LGCCLRCFPDACGSECPILDLMTKVQIHFGLERPLDDELMTRIAYVYSIYGIQKIQVAPSLDSLTVEYDATRLRPAEVQFALASAGIPIAPK
jgi:hypothetical protein